MPSGGHAPRFRAEPASADVAFVSGGVAVYAIVRSMAFALSNGNTPEGQLCDPSRS
jgi:hypothetical protein